MADEQPVTAMRLVFTVNNRRLKVLGDDGIEYDSPTVLEPGQVRQLAQQLINLVSPSHTAIVYVVDVQTQLLVRPVLPSSSTTPGDGAATALTTSDPDMTESTSAGEADLKAAPEEAVPAVNAPASAQVPKARFLIHELRARVEQLETLKGDSAPGTPESPTSDTATAGRAPKRTRAKAPAKKPRKAKDE